MTPSTGLATAPAVAASPLASPSDIARCIGAAAHLLIPHLEQGRQVDAAILRAAMEHAFGGSDTSGAWDWKSAYDACEAATVLFLRKYGKALLRKAGSPALALPMLDKIVGLLPTHTRRSIESEAFQQFSTPIPLGLAVATAAAITPGDRVLEPSAGTGLLAILAEIAGGALVLNELAETRAGLLSLLFPDIAVSRHDAAQIHDHLDAAIVPSVVIMNPPFSAMANVQGRMADAAYRHIDSALARLADGGRLVAITGANFAPDSPAWRDAYVRLQERGRVVFSAAVDGRVYARHGTTFPTRLTVIDKRPADDPTAFPDAPGVAPDVATLLAWIAERISARLPVDASAAVPTVTTPRTVRGYVARTAQAASRPPMAAEPERIELAYETVDWTPPQGARLSDSIYEDYALQSIRIPGAQDHPTQLVQSAAMASVAPPKPGYRPRLPANIFNLLSGAQLETVIYAGEAHSGYLAGAWTVDETLDVVTAAAEDAEGAIRFRRGFMIGDGTGVGKGREAAGIILDNWLRGRRKAVWISKSDKLIEDARRDWSALGMERLLITPLSRFPQGKPITLREGILFLTYATLRSDDRGERLSRVKQIVEWLGSDFDGVIIFDEAHAMQNAVGARSERGDREPSQQGRAGLRLQHALPDARVVYVSATGATTVHNLAYAQRLGLWGSDDFPFSTRPEFVEAIEAGGVAAMEVLARDLRALGLYTSRSLSFDGVEYELVEHALTPEQTRIYDAYADAFAIIHNNLDAAMQAANITGGSEGGSGTLNRQAKAAARSAFESAKQRFFGHLLTSMKTPTLIRAIERDLEQGHAAVVQIVSTGEALMERRLAELPTDEWNDVRVDVTPREYVLDYLAHSFPVQLYEPYTDSEGKLSSRPVYRDGQPVESREAVARRDALIAKLASLPPVPGALDQIVQHFGADMVAEVTGRSRRIVRKPGSAGRSDRLMVETRAASANLAETQAFMDDHKRILVFSDAGGTGRSYHAELSARNTRLRVHYLLEPGWKADTAIQGLGRTHRTNQKQPPLFRPVATSVKAEKRFLSTIARRLERFEAATGLTLTDASGLKDQLPGISTFLNRMLALTIELQGVLFTAFEQLLNARIEGAIAAGTYDVGLETLRAESFVVTGRQTIYTHPGTGAETRLLTIAQRQRNRPLTLDEALSRLSERGARLLVNARSGRAAVQVTAPSVMLDDGEVEYRVRLIRPMEAPNVPVRTMAESHWQDADEASFAAAWTAELAEVPAFTYSTLHMVSGLLLPIWKRLPNESTRVYRLQTDDGERIIGRKVSPAWAATATSTGLPSLTPDDAFAALIDGKTVIDLAEGLQLRRVRVMGGHRIELSGFTDTMRDRLAAYGLFHEIISWKLRLFVPTDASGPAILARVMDRYPIERVGEREAV